MPVHKQHILYADRRKNVSNSGYLWRRDAPNRTIAREFLHVDGTRIVMALCFTHRPFRRLFQQYNSFMGGSGQVSSCWPRHKICSLLIYDRPCTYFLVVFHGHNGPTSVICVFGNIGDEFVLARPSYSF